MDQFQQVAQPAGLQRQVDRVDRLPAEGGIHHDGRERVADGIAGDPVDLGGCVDVVDAVGLDQGAGGDLAGPGLLSGRGGREGEGAARPQAQHARDDARVPHADADDVRVIVHALQEADQGHIVHQRLGGGNDLDEVRIEGDDPGVDAVQVLGGVEVVVADDQRCAGVPQFLHAGFLQRLRGLQFQVHQQKAGLRGLDQDLLFSDDAAGKLAAIGGAAAGRDGGRRHVVGEELLEPGQREQRLVQVVEAELEERVLLHCGGGFLDHLGRCRTDNGDTDLGEAGAE